MKFLFRPIPLRRVLWLALILLLAPLAACSTNSPASTPTRALTRAARVSTGPTKFARVAPTETATATRTPKPTRTPLPRNTDTPTPEDTPTRRATRTPTLIAEGAGLLSSAPPTAAATAPPELKSTDQPTPTATGEFGAELAARLMNPGPCEANGDSQYGVLGAGGWEGRPAEHHADLNLGLRGYRLVNFLRGLVDYDGSTDDNAPQLWGLFADRRTPEIAHTYQVYDWDWGANARGDPITDFEVTLVGLGVSPGETIYTPDFGHEIGEGYVALVLYASRSRVTLKYTGEDNVVDGYTLHLEGVCVNVGLVALYTERNNAGRGALPALRPGQPIGYAPGDEIGVAIRDRGAFLDPRSRKDWWVGR